MSVALLSAQRSKDPSTQVGACIVSPSKRVVGVGYNGFPNKCPDDQLPWGKDSEDENETKYPYCVHAELNAILNTTQMGLKNCTIYVTLFPCSDCTKAIIQSGITHVIYLNEIIKPRYLHSMEASKRMLDLASIPYSKFEKTGRYICLEL